MISPGFMAGRGLFIRGTDEISDKRHCMVNKIGKHHARSKGRVGEGSVDRDIPAQMKDRPVLSRDIYRPGGKARFRSLLSANPKTRRIQMFASGQEAA
jgi:hypothetical protein